MRAVLDTNVLIYSFINKVDITSELEKNGISEVVLPESVLEELNNIKNRGGKEGRVAKSVISYVEKLVEKGKVRIVETEGSGDDAIVEAAEKYGCAVITNDLELRRRAKERKLATGCFRGKSRIMIF